MRHYLRRHKNTTHRGVRIKLIFRTYDLEGAAAKGMYHLASHEDFTILELTSDEMYTMAKYTSHDGICYPLGGQLDRQGFPMEPVMLTPVGIAGKFLVMEVEAMELPNAN